MTKYTIAAGLLALLIHSEVVTLALLSVGAVLAVYKLFAAQAERGA